MSVKNAFDASRYWRQARAWFRCASMVASRAMAHSGQWLVSVPVAWLFTVFSLTLGPFPPPVGWMVQ